MVIHEKLNRGQLDSVVDLEDISSLVQEASSALWFAIVVAKAPTVSSLLTVFQTASLFAGGSHSWCQRTLMHSESVLCPAL